MSQLDDSPLPNGKLVLRIIPQPANTNSSGDISGGWVLLQMDIAAEETARSVAKGRVAMVACEGASFLSPVKMGSALCCYTKITDIGKSSVQVHVEVWTQNPQDDARRKVCDSTMVYVAIEESGRIRALPIND